MLISRKIRYNNILDIWFTDEEGIIKNYHEPITEEHSYNWVEAKKGGYEGISWDGKKIRKQNVMSRDMTQYRIIEYMYENFDEDIRNRIFSHTMPKRQFFCDIETEMMEDFRNISEKTASQRIYSIALQSNSTILVLATNDLSKQQLEEIQVDVNEYFKQYKQIFHIKFKYYEQEEDMLFDFFNVLCSKMDVITGWNFEDFDWKYMVCRAKYLNVKINNLKINSLYMPDNLIVVDYLKLCKKYEISINMKESSKLNDVALQICKLSKIQYDKDLSDLYINNKQKFIYYNIVDTMLVYFIDKLTKCFEVHCQINNISEAGIYKCFGSVALIESLMIKDFLKEDKHTFECYKDPRNKKKEDDKNKNKKKTKMGPFIIDEEDEDDEREELQGGFVYDLTPGFYKNVSSLDFASLYPSIVRQFNISPETILGKEDDLDNDIVSNNIRTSWGSVYDKSKKGILPSIVETNYFKRKSVQKEVSDDYVLLEQINNELVKRNVV